MSKLSYRAKDQVDAPPPTEQVLMSQWHGSIPVVSVIVPTYNHERFISECLNGVLRQKTIFPFEVIVRDDGSSDATGVIVEAFAARYPNIVRAHILPENTWPNEKPVTAIEPLTRGMFIALCDGDDFWLDETKLQRQFDVLSRNSKFAVSAHVVLVSSDTGVSLAPRNRPPLIIPKDRPDLFCEKLPTLSLMFRKGEGMPRSAMLAAPYADVVLKSWLATQGSAHLDRSLVGGVYRIHDSGLLSSDKAINQYRQSIKSQLVATQWLVSVDSFDAAAEMLDLSNLSLIRMMDLNRKTLNFRKRHNPILLSPWWKVRIRRRLRDVGFLRFLHSSLKRMRN